MAELPKLYPGHQHQWVDVKELLVTEWVPSALVVCTVCGFQAPRNAAGLDGRMTQPRPEQEPA